jgi:hypothetical protein
MGFALKEKNEDTGKFTAICKCKVDPANPDLTCGKKLTMPDGSTSSIRHHIKTRHPQDWVRLLTEEKSKAEQAVAQQLVADQTLAEIEGDPDEIEEDLSQVQVSQIRVIFVTFAKFRLFRKIFRNFCYFTFIPVLFSNFDQDPNTPGPSRKRPADEVLAETPKRPKPTPGSKVSPRRAYFTRIVKCNVQDKKQLNFDIKLARLLVALNCSFTQLQNEEVKKFCDEFLPEYHVKHQSTFSRY